jgi:ribosomal protein S12 methylthiotransferase
MNAHAARRITLPVLPQAEPAAPDSGAAATVFGEPAADAPRIGIVTLGCDKNTVDTERLLARLAGAGARLAEAPDAADVVIVNTCGFIDAAKEESIETVLDAVRLKAAGRVRAVVAMGCLVQRYGRELAGEIPEVDLFLGLTEAERLVPELRARGLLGAGPAVPTMERPLRLLSTRRRHSSFLKVSEGCDHACAFCAIPLMRGRHRSTPIDVLVREARELEAAGVVELNLISQDTTWYGRDVQRGAASGPADFFVGRPFAGMVGGPKVADPPRDRPARAAQAGPRTGLLPDLLRALLDATAVRWLRLFYMYPSGIRRELVELMADEPRIAPYLDMPIQHGADAVLQRMRRPERRSTILERVAWLRDAIPDLTLRTTVVIGFPGETEDEFEALLDLLETVRFDRVGAFAYSVEEGTAAAALPDQVPEGVRRERLERLSEVQQGIAAERLEAWIGREVDVLIDRRIGRDPAAPGRAGSARGAVGRTAGQAPEVDGVVHLADAGGAGPGDFVRARIVDVVDEDLVAERIGDR